MKVRSGSYGPSENPSTCITRGTFHLKERACGSSGHLYQRTATNNFPPEMMKLPCTNNNTFEFQLRTGVKGPPRSILGQTISPNESLQTLAIHFSLPLSPRSLSISISVSLSLSLSLALSLSLSHHPHVHTCGTFLLTAAEGADLCRGFLGRKSMLTTSTCSTRMRKGVASFWGFRTGPRRFRREPCRHTASIVRSDGASDRYGGQGGSVHLCLSLICS